MQKVTEGNHFGLFTDMFEDATLNQGFWKNASHYPGGFGYEEVIPPQGFNQVNIDGSARWFANGSNQQERVVSLQNPGFLWARTDW